ncbi:hypothetical protein N0V83_001696 [Neocucurbitaria cava]|uniref:Uncharacterized protein n=1 Tax=Neocucurbitaria cava TaxID=798079 RepID=A0A9W8YIV7_9PLEO|nr:hypothetical protein N0V83_001696 [Neocucurbitaria cava]
MSSVRQTYTALPPKSRPEEVQPYQYISQFGIGTEPWHSVKESDATSTAASCLDFNVGQWLPTSPQISVFPDGIVHEGRQKLQREINSSIEVEELPRAARIVFTNLYTKLGSETFSQLCDRTFTRWEGFVQHLRDDQSDCYAVYAKILEDLYAVLHAIDSGAIHAAKYGSTEQSLTYRPLHDVEGGSREPGSLSLGLSANPVSPASQGSKLVGHRASRVNGSSRNLKVATGNKSKRAGSRAVDCPEYKHHIMHGTHPPSCGGCSEVVMSQVRSHLKRVDHRDFPSGVWQCPRCKKDFVDQSIYDLHHRDDTCRHQPQIRKDIELPWARLYLSRYPTATRIPIPYCDQNGWLPDSILAQCRLSLANSSASFLGQHDSGPSGMQGHIPANVTSIDGASYNAGLSFMLQDLLDPSSSHAHEQATVLARRVSGLNTIDPQTFTQGPATADVERFSRALHNASRDYFRMLAMAPQYLTDDQLRQTANEAAAVVHQIRNYQEQSQQNQIAALPYPSSAQEQPLGRHVNPAYVPPWHNPPSPSASNEQYAAAGMSTQPSSQGFDTASSQYRLSMQTTSPSSAYNSSNQMLLSPFATPQDYRRTSVSSQAATGAPHHYRASSATRSLHDECLQARNRVNPSFTTIDPSLLTTPHSDSGHEVDYLRRQFFPGGN